MASDTTTLTISNMALDRLGANNIDNFDTDTSPQAVKCRLYYDQTRETLLRSYDWPFAVTRLSLTEHEDAPDFQWDNQFDLPTDFLRLTDDYTVDGSNLVNDRWAVESNRVLTNESEVDLIYIRNEDDPTKFDPLFIEMQVLTMAKKMVYPLAGAGRAAVTLSRDLKEEIKELDSKIKMVIDRETNVTGRSDWNLARYRSRGVV